MSGSTWAFGNAVPEKDIPTRFDRLVEKLRSGVRADPLVECKVRGEPLSQPVIWEGRQWAVTAHGLERRDGTYSVEASKLFEGDGAEFWTYQLGLKGDVDAEDLIVALVLARLHHAEAHKSSK